MSGLKLSRLACRSTNVVVGSFGALSPLGLTCDVCCDCDPRRDHEEGVHDSSYAVACLCSLDSRRLIRHCVVESLLPVLMISYFGLVGLTELVIIVGIGIDVHDDESTC